MAINDFLSRGNFEARVRNDGFDRTTVLIQAINDAITRSPRSLGQAFPPPSLLQKRYGVDFRFVANALAYCTQRGILTEHPVEMPRHRVGTAVDLETLQAIPGITVREVALDELPTRKQVLVYRLQGLSKLDAVCHAYHDWFLQNQGRLAGRALPVAALVGARYAHAAEDLNIPTATVHKVFSFFKRPGIGLLGVLHPTSQRFIIQAPAPGQSNPTRYWAARAVRKQVVPLTALPDAEAFARLQREDNPPQTKTLQVFTLLKQSIETHRTDWAGHTLPRAQDLAAHWTRKTSSVSKTTILGAFRWLQDAGLLDLSCEGARIVPPGQASGWTRRYGEYQTQRDAFQNYLAGFALEKPALQNPIRIMALKAYVRTYGLTHSPVATHLYQAFAKDGFLEKRTVKHGDSPWFLVKLPPPVAGKSKATVIQSLVRYLRDTGDTQLTPEDIMSRFTLSPAAAKAVHRAIRRKSSTV